MKNLKKNLEFTAKKLPKLATNNWRLLMPSLDENHFLIYQNWINYRSSIREDAERLPECLRLLSKITSQYITEIDYECGSVNEEADAKIRAQEELVNPQIAKLNNDYKRKIKA